MMLKYLTKKNNTYWYRRKLLGFGEVVFSLKTKDYSIAVVRHSYVDHKIKSLIQKGIFEKMTVDEIREIIDKYKTYMLNEEYNDFEDQRDKELTVKIDGKQYGGHTDKALEYAIKRYSYLHQSNDNNLIKKEALKILERSNIKDDYKKLKTDKEKNIFHWELVKGEWELLYQNYSEQLSKFGHLKPEVNEKQEKAQSINSETKILTISQLTKKYIDENKNAKKWSDKNERDILYVLGEFSDYYEDKKANQVVRDDFTLFRDKVLKYLPQKRSKNIFNEKSTKEVISMVKKYKYDTISTTTINKHLRRLHQVFEWAYNCDYIDKNLSKNLKIKEENKSKTQKTARVPYFNKDLKKIFEESPWFNQNLLQVLNDNPEYVFIPLLALYTGAKPSELAQLTPQAFIIKNKILGIDFNMMIKTTHSERFTPLSNELLNLGFMKFVNHQKGNKEKQLFPSVKVYADNGTNFTNAFTIYNRKYISQDKDKTFYSFRHLVNQMLKNKRIPTYIINDIIGHSHTANKDEGTYGADQMPEQVLYDIINECLIYDFINFSKIKEAIDNFYK